MTSVVSIDGATVKSGIAWWEDGTLVETGLLRRVGSGPRYASWMWSSGKLKKCSALSGRFEAWQAMVKGCDVVVGEKSWAGVNQRTALSLSNNQGFIQAAAEDAGAKYFEVTPSEWRRVVGKRFNTEWPKDGDLKKAKAIELVRAFFDLDVSEDEAEAVLAGVWYYHAVRFTEELTSRVIRS